MYTNFVETVFRRSWWYQFFRDEADGDYREKIRVEFRKKGGSVDFFRFFGYHKRVYMYVGYGDIDIKTGGQAGGREGFARG